MDAVDLNLVQQCAGVLPHWLWVLLAPALAGVVSHLDAWIKQPSAGSIWLLIRKPLSVLAGNYGWAKNADQETLVEWWSANRQAFAAWLFQLAAVAIQAAIVRAAAQTTAAQSAASVPSETPPPAFPSAAPPAAALPEGDQSHA
jgi:hypothetical protein